MGCGRSKPKVVAPRDGRRPSGNKISDIGAGEELHGGGDVKVTDKRVSRESSDLFFSSRKEDDPRGDDDAGSEYFSDAECKCKICSHVLIYFIFLKKFLLFFLSGSQGIDRVLGKSEK